MIELGRVWIGSQIMPLFMKCIWCSQKVFPLGQSFAFALITDNERTKKIITFTQVFIPNGNNKRLFVQFTRTCFKTKFFIKNWIQVTPFNTCLIFSVAMRVRFQLATNEMEIILINTYNNVLNTLKGSTYSLTNGSEKPLLSITMRPVQRFT